MSLSIEKNFEGSLQDFNTMNTTQGLLSALKFTGDSTHMLNLMSTCLVQWNGCIGCHVKIKLFYTIILTMMKIKLLMPPLAGEILINVK